MALKLFNYFEHRPKKQSKDIVTISKNGSIYIPNYTIEKNGIVYKRFDTFLDDEKKTIIALHFHKEGKLKLSSTGSRSIKSCGYYASIKTLLKHIKYDFSVKRRFNYTYKDGLMIINLNNRDIVAI